MSYFRFSVGLWGRVDSNHWTPKRTDLQSVAIATMRLPHFRCSQSVGTRADEGTRTPDRLITNQLLYQLSYIGFFSVSNNSLSLNLRLQKYYFFPNTPKFFFTFRIFLSQQIGLQHHFISKKTYHLLSTTPQNPHFYTSHSHFSPPEGIKKIPHTHNIWIHSIINPTHHSSTPLPIPSIALIIIILHNKLPFAIRRASQFSILYIVIVKSISYRFEYSFPPLIGAKAERTQSEPRANPERRQSEPRVEANVYYNYTKKVKN